MCVCVRPVRIVERVREELLLSILVEEEENLLAETACSVFSLLPSPQRGEEKEDSEIIHEGHVHLPSPPPLDVGGKKEGVASLLLTD